MELFRQFYNGLPPAPPHFGGMGLGDTPMLLNANDKRYSILLAPEIAHIVTAGSVAPRVDIRNNVKGILNQGAEGSCVAFSTCGAIATDHFTFQGSWVDFDARQLYHEMGGTGQNGVDSRGTLQKCVDQGAPVANSSTRIRIGSYLWVDQVQRQARQQIAAALTLNQTVCMAMLLPSGFGWRSTGGPTQGYHQLYVVGYEGLNDNDYIILANSWGPGFGQAGFVGVTWGYWEGDPSAPFLHNYNFALTFRPENFNPPPPPPPPVKKRTLFAIATGDGAPLLVVGQTLTAGNVNLQITQISDDTPPPPPPPPDQLAVTGYSPNPVKVGQQFSILGQKFAAGASVTFNGTSLQASVASGTEIRATAPSQPVSGAVVVTQQGEFATGPTLTVSSDGPGPTPGTLVIEPTVGDVGRSYILSAIIKDANGVPLSANCEATVGGLSLGNRHSTVLGPNRVIPCVWSASHYRGQRVRLHATSDADGAVGERDFDIPA